MSKVSAAVAAGIFLSALLAYPAAANGVDLPPINLSAYETHSTAGVANSYSTQHQTAVSSSAMRDIPTPNPYSGNLGEPSSFPNVGAAAAGAHGGPLDAITPFAYASAQSSAPEVNTGSYVRYAFALLAPQEEYVHVNINALVAQSFGYFTLGANAEGAVHYGDLGQNSQADVVIQIQSLDDINIPITSFVKQCGIYNSECSGSRGDLVQWNNSYNFKTNSRYYISLNAGAFTKAPTLIGNIATVTFATAYVDPYFTLDASVQNPEQYVFRFSEGVRNLSPNAGVPEPATWALMICGFGVAGSGLRRRRTAA